MKLPRDVQELLIRKAESIHNKAYAPYSRFKVGAAVLSDSDTIYTGCNVENGSYGLSVCAERNAVAAAVAGGDHKIKAVAIYTPTSEVTVPCGACRQVLSEFNPDMDVLLINKDRQVQSMRLSDLMPKPFLFEGSPHE